MGKGAAAGPPYTPPHSDIPCRPRPASQVLRRKARSGLRGSQTLFPRPESAACLLRQAHASPSSDPHQTRLPLETVLGLWEVTLLPLPGRDTVHVWPGAGPPRASHVSWERPQRGELAPSSSRSQGGRFQRDESLWPSRWAGRTGWPGGQVSNPVRPGSAPVGGAPLCQGDLGSGHTVWLLHGGPEDRPHFCVRGRARLGSRRHILVE